MKITKYLTIPLAAAMSMGAVTVANAAGEYQITDKELELDLHFHFRDKYAWDNEWPVAKRIAELTNIKLNGVASKSGTNTKELFNLMLVSGDLPDIVGGNQLKDSFMQYGMEGAFIGLNDLIDEHAPNIKAFFEANPDIKASITAPDGEIYYIPYLPDGTPGRGYYVRQDWLDKLGLETPTTVDEYYKVLKAFREQDPNGNGKKDEIPYFNRKAEEVYRLVTLFGARSTGSETYVDFMYDGEVSHPWTTPEFKYGITQVAKWYKEGLIDKEIFTRGNKARDQLIKGDNLGGSTHDWFASTAGYNDNSPIEGFSFLPILPPADVNGRVIEEHGRASVKPDGWAITVANEHQVESIKLFDFYFTEAGRNMANFGVEGDTWTMVDGKPTFTKEVLEKGGVLSQMWSVGAQVPLGFHQDYAYELQWTNPIAVEGINKYLEADVIEKPFLGLNLNVQEKKVYDKYWPTIETFMKEETQAWILGAKDVDASWDDYIAKLDQMKLGNVVEVLNAAYSRQYK